ncbi:MAG: cytochrome c peroxidase [Sneathiella sp.]
MLGSAAASEPVPTYDDAEISRILSHGPWPPAAPADPSNKFSGDENAIKLGYQLFHDQRLSRGNVLACASCHQPDRLFMDGVPLNRGHQLLDRHTPSLANLRWANWFSWDGANDNLWAQSIRPILTPAEMDSSAEHLKKVIVKDPVLSCGFAKTFNTAAMKTDSEKLLVLTGKALAAYQETLITEPSSFDHFVTALQQNDRKGMAAYPLAAQRGLKIFIGEGRCNLCHFGPLFTNGEFADIGIPHFIGKGKVDKGRFGGIVKLNNSPYNLLGSYSDGSELDAIRTQHIKSQFRNFGEFKVPSLRNVADTSPYMHNGSLATLEDVVDHYSELNEDRLHSEGEKILRPLNLSVLEKEDLVSFLQTLSAPIMVRDQTFSKIKDC